MTYETLKKANESIFTMKVKDNDYAPVNQRIKAFRMVYPEGFISTMIVSLENGQVIFRAEVGYYKEDGSKVVLGEGTAMEKESSSYINKTSYIENCETSAIGRALGMAGYGIDTSIASAEEVGNAVLNQEQKPAIKKAQPQPQVAPQAPQTQMELPDSKDQLAFMLEGLGVDIKKVLVAYKRASLEEMPIEELKQAYIRKYNSVNSAKVVKA